MRFLVVLALTIAVAAAASMQSDRIIGGTVTTINQYPEAAQLLSCSGNFCWQDCGGTILNNRAILSAAHCTINSSAAGRRIRYGSTNRSSGGTVVTVNRIINHPNYNRPAALDNDICILWVNGNIPNTATSRPASIAGSNYHLADNQVVWAAGWGTTIAGNSNSMSEQLRHVQVWTVNQNVCRTRYLNHREPNGVLRPLTVTDNMLCAGWLDVGGRDACQGDSGGPLYHNRVIVGVTSWGSGCGRAQYPGVSARVTRYTNWINQNR